MKEENEKVEETTPEVKGENLPPDCHCDAKLVLQGEPVNFSRSLEEEPSAAGLLRKGRAAEGASFPEASGKRDDPQLARTRVAIRSPSEEVQPDEEKSDEAAQLRAELESVRGQVTRLEHERYLLSRGVPEEDLDYYAFKIEHMEGAKSDFRKAAKEYLKAHPVRRTAVSSGADLTAGSTRKPATSSELMNQLLRNH